MESQQIIIKGIPFCKNGVKHGVETFHLLHYILDRFWTASPFHFWNIVSDSDVAFHKHKQYTVMGTSI